MNKSLLECPPIEQLHAWDDPYLLKQAPFLQRFDVWKASSPTEKEHLKRRKQFVKDLRAAGVEQVLQLWVDSAFNEINEFTNKGKKVVADRSMLALFVDIQWALAKGNPKEALDFLKSEYRKRKFQCTPVPEYRPPISERPVASTYPRTSAAKRGARVDLRKDNKRFKAESKTRKTNCEPEIIAPSASCAKSSETKSSAPADLRTARCRSHNGTIPSPQPQQSQTLSSLLEEEAPRRKRNRGRKKAVNAGTNTVHTPRGTLPATSTQARGPEAQNPLSPLSGLPPIDSQNTPEDAPFATKPKEEQLDPTDLMMAPTYDTNNDIFRIHQHTYNPPATSIQGTSSGPWISPPVEVSDGHYSDSEATLIENPGSRDSVQEVGALSRRSRNPSHFQISQPNPMSPIGCKK
ncbi:hypothetical protein NP233_g4443 [Leucocoprinus birnbaumii]|uniref:Uncharacterized protein n=1 Tax=Leucocoprinus birnbaumii TaxID=56174 RepID=A0AAD5VXE5_9AGAR|nr:hypothetical protein NP233_g4443 [Leucocoprinus birnbaumii]